MKEIKTMYDIKNIRSISDLAQYDSMVREHALILIKDKDIADELTQELYINIHKYLTKYPEKIIDGGLISVTLRNLHRNYYRYECNRYDRGGENYEVSFPDKPDDFEEIYTEKIEEERLLTKYENAFKNNLSRLNWYEAKLWEFTQIMTLSDFSKKSDIDYRSLRRTMKKIKEKLRTI